jgi:hypothetical protein
MIEPALIATLKESASTYKQSCIDNPEKCQLTKSERLWMEELSKVYLCAELDIDVPETANAEFLEKIRTITSFGHDSTLTTRLITYAANILSDKEFRTNAARFITTLDTHEKHWAQQHVESSHSYTKKRPVEDFMHDYFAVPESIMKEELTYYLTFYFKHFYRLLYQFMLFYTQSHSPVYYGRAHS